MAILTINGTITEDESAGLQTSGIPAPPVNPTEDNNDNDVTSLSSALATQLSEAITADMVSVPSPVTGFFPSFAQVNGFATVALAGATNSNIFFSDGSGNPLINFDSGLNTTSGHDILLTTASDDNVVYGKDALTGALVFAIVLNETPPGGPTTGADIGIAQYQAIANPVAGGPSVANFDDPVDLLNHLFLSVATETVISNFSLAPPGQNLWITVPSGGALGNPGILVTGITPNPGQPTAGDRVNVSTTGLGENAQAVDHLEGLRIDLVNVDFVPDQKQADDPNFLSYNGHVSSSGAGWSPVQVNPGGSNIRVDAQMAAFNATADNEGPAFFTDITSGNPAQTQAAIGSVEVFSSSGASFGTATRPPGGSGNAVPLSGGVNTDAALTVDFLAGGVATVHGLLDDYRVEFRTTDPAGFDRFTITNVTSQPNRTFDVGRITILEAASETDEVGSKVIFEDDGPSITASAVNAPTLTVDETVLTTNATASFAAQFTSSFGADGAAAATPVSYALSTAGGTSGLTDTATGASVVLTLESGQVVGRAAAGGPIVFVVSVNTSGQVTLDQQRAVVHTNPNDPDESRGLTGSNLVVLTGTATDGDADHAAASLDLTPLLVFKDDGPSITASATGAPTLTVDETVLATNATASFAAQFTSSFGADGQGATPVSYALSTPGGASGLTDTATGASVLLFLESGQVVGRAGSAAGAIVFTVSVDASGQATLDQQRAVVHTNPNDPDESRSLTGSNLVVLTGTATDGDADHAAASLDLTPLLVFKDDGPSITASAVNAPTLTVDETVLATDATGSFAAQFTPTFGADGQGATPVSYALSTPGGASGLTDTATNTSVVLFLESGQVVGRAGSAAGAIVFTVSVDASGQVTLDQQRAIVHTNPNDPDESRALGAAGDNKVVLTATATDKDGDHAAAPLDLTPLLVFKDDGPTITVDNIANGTYAAGGSSTWSEAPNADGFKSLNVTLNNYTIDSKPTVTVDGSLGTLTGTDANGNFVFNGTINADFNGDGTSDMVTFKLTFDATDPGKDTYKIDVTTPPSTVTTFDTSQGTLAPGGPDPVQTLTFSSGPSAGKTVVFFGAMADAPQNDGVVGSPPNDIEDLVKLGEPDLTESQIQAFLGPPNQIPTLINSSTQMNVSTSGIGVNNNNFDGSGAGIQPTDESFVVNPELPVDKVTVFIDNSVGGYNPNTEDLEYRAYFIDGSVSATTKVLAGDLTPVTTGPAKGGNSFDISDVAGGPQIDAVQLIMANGTVKIPVIQFSIQQTFAPQSLNMNLTATLTDGDNDTKQDTFSIALA